jgi:hypothetical protein
MPRIHRVRKDVEDTVTALIDVLGLERDPNMMAYRIQNALKFKRQGDFARYNAIIETLHNDMQSCEEE